VIFANRKFAETVGMPAELVSETACGVLGCVQPLDDPRGCGYGRFCADCGLRLAIEDTFRTGSIHLDVKHATEIDRGGGRHEVVWLAATAAIPTGDRPKILLELQDVTLQSRMEEALRKSEESYRAVVEDQTEVISRFRTDGTILFVNDVYCRFFGKRSDEIIGSKWQPLAVSEDVSHIEALLHELSPSNPTVLVENRVHTGDGEIRWMQFVNRGFFNEAGDLEEIQSVGRDVTERKMPKEKASRYRRELQI
jgi:PAS domain S-box-containing protein